MKKALLLIAFLAAFSCSTFMGEEIARLPINTVSNGEIVSVKEAVIPLLQNDTISFWSEIDMKYEGDLTLNFVVEVYKEDKLVSNFQIDPTEKNITINEVKSDFIGKVSWRFSGKNYEMPIEEAGNYKIRAILIATDNPSLVLKKAELVIKK